MGFLDKVHDDLSTRLLIGHPFKVNNIDTKRYWALF